MQLEINLLPAHESNEEVQEIIVSLMSFLELSFNRNLVTVAGDNQESKNNNDNTHWDQRRICDGLQLRGLAN